MVKRIISLAVGLSVFATLTAGCTGKGSTTTATATPAATASSQPKPVTITVGGYPKATDTKYREIFDTNAKNLTEKYPYITVKFDEYSYDVNTFMPKAASGQLPNLYSTPYTEADKIITAGYAADITEGMKNNGYDGAINPELMKLVIKGGKTYGIPNSAYVTGLLMNMNLFKAAGLVDDKGIPKAPKTFDELAQTAKTIKDKTGKTGMFLTTKNNQGGWQFMSIAWGFGTEFEKKVDGKWKATFNSPEGVAALQYVKDLKWKYDVLQDNALADLNDMSKLIGTDQVAMCFADPNWTQGPIVNYKASKDNFASAPMPAGPKGSFPLLGGSLSIMSNNSSKEQIDAGLKWLDASGAGPTMSDATAQGAETRYKTFNEAGKIVGPKGLEVWINKDRVAKGDAILAKYINVNMALFNDYQNGLKNLKPEEPVNCQELYKALDGVIQSVLSDSKADPKKLLDDAAAAFQKDYLDKAQ
jgi:ABC-type glycerol-3-phosphate transport system substrate-binding protein